LGLARVLEQEGSYREAVDAYENMARKYPKSTEGLNALMQAGRLLLGKLSEADRAEELFKRVVRQSPRAQLRTQANFYLGDCAVFNNDLTGAKRIFEKILKETKANTLQFRQAHLSLARVSFYQGIPGKASEHLGNIFNDLKSNDIDVHENDALELNMLLQENDQDSLGLAVFGRAHLLAFQHQYQQAGELIEQVLKDNSHFNLKEQMLLFISRIYRHLGQYDSALQTLEQVYKDEESIHRDLSLKRIAEIYETDLLQPAMAQSSYESILKYFPDSIYVEEARKHVRQLDRQ
jgi:tetratricopeptide (TPR) repeat protein